MTGHAPFNTLRASKPAPAALEPLREAELCIIALEDALSEIRTELDGLIANRVVDGGPVERKLRELLDRIDDALAIPDDEEN